MKKLLSMVLALALVLTTIVVPMTVSAADADITIEYAISAESADGVARENVYYPGDTVTVDINAVSTADDTAIAGYDIYIPWTGAGATAAAVEKVFGAGDSNVEAELLGNSNIFLYATDQEALTFGTTATTLATLTFTVADSALNGYSIPATDAESYATLTSVWDDVPVTADTAEYTVGSHIVTLTAASTSISETEITATTSNDSIALKSENAETITLTLASSTGGAITNAKVYSAASQSGEYTTEVATFAEGEAEVNAFGYYKVVCDTQNKTGYEFYFNYKTDITPDLNFVVSGTGVESGNTFTVTVSASELGENKAEVVDFTVVPDAGITLQSVEKATDVSGAIENVDGQITYESGEEGGVANGGAIAVLTFATDANEIGTYGVAFNNQKLAVSQAYDGAETTLTEAADTIKVTIYKGAEAFSFAALDGVYTTTKTQEVNYAEGWSAKDGEASYKVVASTGAATAAEEMFAATENAAELEIPGTITYDKVDYNYYTVARFGAEGSYVYEIIKSLTAEEIKLDGEAPTIAISMEFQEYMNYVDIQSIPFDVADDKKLADDKLYYSFVRADDVANNSVGVTEGVANVPLTDDSVVYNAIYVKTTDEAGHETVETIAIKYDNVDPVISATAGLLEGNQVPITVTVSEDTITPQSNINTTVTVLYKTEEGAEPAEKETITVEIGVGDEYMADNGFYAFKATDAAGNETTTEYIQVSTDKKAPVGISPKFAIKTGVTAENAGSLKNDKWLEDAYKGTGIAPSNGSFAYLEMFENDAATGTVEEAGTYATKYTLVGPDGEEVADWDYKLDAKEDAKGEYKLTVKVYMTNNEANDYQEEKFTFSIYSNTDTEFATLNGNNTYTIADYSRLKKMVNGSDNKTDTEFAEVAEFFEGGFFCGDLDASLDGNYIADRAAFINQLKTAKRASQYEFAIYNNITPAE